MRVALQYPFEAYGEPCGPGAGVVGDTRTLGLAVSGGSDSLAMLALAAEIRTHDGGLSLAAVTVDHGLRPEAAAEAEQVGRICRELGVPHSIVRWERADTGAVSQADARRARHQLLATWAAAHGVSQIALAHTRDDRLETFLMRARQGSGWYGLAGLMPYAPSPVWPQGAALRLVRPLLAFTREDLRDDLRARGIAWIDDPSNAADRFERVRMRHLLARLPPSTKDTAIRTMDRLAEMRMATASAAFELLSRHVDQQASTARLPLDSRHLVGPESWRRFIEAMVMAAGGAVIPPRGEGLARLLDLIATHDPALRGGVTLAGAKIRTGTGVLLGFSRAPRRSGQGTGPAGQPDWGRAARLLQPTNLGPLWV